MSKLKYIFMVLVLAGAITAIVPQKANAATAGPNYIDWHDTTIFNNRNVQRTIKVEATCCCIISMYDANWHILWSSDWSNQNLYRNSSIWYGGFCYENWYYCGSDVKYIVARSTGAVGTVRVVY